METQRLCPITGEPLTEPGQTVSHTALSVLRSETNDLRGLMTDLGNRLAGEAHPKKAIQRRPQPKSTPPISLGLLDAIDEGRDLITEWAWHIMQHINPAWRMPTGHPWATIQAIYQQHLPHLSQWVYAPTMIDELNHVLPHLKRLAGYIDPPAILASVDDLPDKHLTIGPAVQAVKLATGKHLAKKTVYSWEYRGKISSHGDPKKYSMRELLTLATADTPTGA